MFTFIRNYKANFTLTFRSCFLNNGFNNIVESDTNEDGSMDVDEFNALSDRQKRSVQRFLERQDKWDNFVEDRRIAYRRKEEGQSAVTQQTSTEQEEYRESITQQIQYPPQGREATLALQTLIGTAADGAFGPNSRKTLQIFLKNAGHYTGAIDGDIGRGSRAAIDAYNRGTIGEVEVSTRQREYGVTMSNETTETTTQQIQYPPQGREATLALQTLIGTAADGAFGPNSRKTLQIFLKNAGHYTGAIDGDIGRGSRAAIDAYNRGTIGGAVNTVNTVNRNSFDRFFGIGKRNEIRAQIDQYIGASDADLISLGHEAGNAKISGNREEINKVYTAIIQELSQRGLPQNIINAFNVSSQRQKMIVLDYFENALMGSASSEQVARGELGAELYLANSNRVLAEAARVLDGYSFKDQTLSNVQRLRQYMIGQLDSVALDEGVYFSVRTQGDLSRFSPFTSAQEAIVLNGETMWDVPENNEDILKLIEQMSTNQLNYIKRSIGFSDTLTKEKLSELVRSGDVTFDIKMFLAENCSNISYSLIPTTNIDFSSSYNRISDDNGVISTDTGTEGVGRVEGTEGAVWGGSGNTTLDDTGSNLFGQTKNII